MSETHKRCEIIADAVPLDGGGRITVIRLLDDVPQPPTPVQPVTAQPGRAWADAAYRAGREDEYSDLMQTRAGGEW